MNRSIVRVQRELDACLFLSELDTSMRRRQSERLSDGAFAVMGLGMVVVVLAACVAACASLSGAM